MNKDWSNLTEENQIAEIIALSNSIPVYIFKHSTTCGISAQAKENVEISYECLVALQCHPEETERGKTSQQSCQLTLSATSITITPKDFN